MPGQVKFTAYGVPYVEEFSNITIAPAADAPITGSKLSRCPTCGTHSKHESTSSSGGGIFIQIPRRRHSTTGYPSMPPTRKLSEGRLLRLKHAIADAVTNAGMSTPPPGEELKEEAALQTSRFLGKFRPLLRRGSTSSSTSTASKSASTSLYRGTYGQVMNALNSAGLVTTPCPSSGFEQATRLGALFVAKTNDDGAVRFEKLTLWG